MSLITQAQQPDGTWALPLGKRTLLVLRLGPNQGDGQACSGSLSRAAHMQTRDFSSFSQVSGPIESERIVACAQQATALGITVQHGTDTSDRETYRFQPKGVNEAELSMEGVALPPMHLVRSAEEAKVSEDWDPSRTYTPDDDAPSNAEMKRIFEEDQRVRQAWPSIDWNTVRTTDAERQAATRKLLQQGALHSGEDFCWAAFVFQHGSTPDDYLLAHTLSVIAVKKGYTAAVWITAATLDRYLQAIKQPQIYGTQFATPGDKPASQAPFHTTLISDALRHQLDVPSLAEQQVQRKKYDTERHVPENQAGSSRRP